MDDPIRVLHVDDDAAFGAVVADLLAEHSDRMDVDTTTEPAAVIGLLADGAYDCVVSDYQMGEMDGLALLDRVRTEYPDLPFVLFTSQGSEEIASEAIAAGVTDYVRKGTGTERVAILANRIENAVEQYLAERTLAERERSLRRKDKMLEAILQHVPLHVYVKDEQARHTWVSDYGLGSPDMIGKTDVEYFDADWATETTREELDIIETGEPIIDQERYDDAADVWVRNTKLPWRNDEGEIVGLVGATWDVTPQKRSERERERHRSRVERLRYAVSHELRNPLQLAEGRLELAGEDCSSSHLDTVESAHSQFNTLIQETVRLVEAGRPVEATTPVEVEAIARQHWAELDGDADGLSVEGDPTVGADRERLGDLLAELLENAAVHAGPEPAVSVAPIEDGFVIDDDGPGVPSSERERVFEVGYTTDHERTGFGLSVAREIAEAHNWSIAIEESPAGGTRVVLTTTVR